MGLDFKTGLFIGVGIAVGGLLVCSVLGLISMSFGGGGIGSSGGSTNLWSNGT
jgi:hypothetical protein